MASKIVIVGATGNLGHRITRSLLARGADTVALVRNCTDADKILALRGLGAEVISVDLSNVEDIASGCAGSACVVSALQGLHDVIVDVQTRLLQGVIAAKGPRFIPSDFASNFMKLPTGQNRNFDLRREFHRALDAAPIAATSIFNGAFGEILSYGTPLLDTSKKEVAYWEDPDWHIDFTTMDDTAAYTAAAALDATTPRALRIASFQVSPKELANAASETFKTTFKLVRLGSRDELAAHNKQERAAHPEGEQELYPSWQQSQYLHSMFSVHHSSLDNDRYRDIKWTPLQAVLRSITNTSRSAKEV